MDKERSQRIALVYMIILVLASGYSSYSLADTPLSTFRQFSGPIDFTIIGNTLRSRPDSNVVTDSCSLITNSTAQLTQGQIPTNSTIKTAYLYWAGSFSESFGSNQKIPDNQVTLNGQSILAEQMYFARTIPINKSPLDFFVGRADVTSLVANRGLGTYTFGDLSVNTASPHCFDILASQPSRTVLAGWSLVIIYELDSVGLSTQNNIANRLIRIQDGFQALQNSSITMNEDNLVIADSNSSKIGYLVFEGDFGDGNNGVNATTESFQVNNVPLPVINDFLNTPTDIFNSTINKTFNNRAYGVDADVFDISSILNSSTNSVMTQYSTGNDIILLTMQIIGIVGSAVGAQVDLALTLDHAEDFFVNEIGRFRVAVNNLGNLTEPGEISVIIPLPSGISFNGFTGDGYNCTDSVTFIRCTHNMDLAPGARLPDLFIDVNIAPIAAPSVNLNAGVTSPSIDRNQLDNQDFDSINVVAPNLSTSTKTLEDLNGGIASPGDIIRYTITITESNGASVSGVSVTDDLPAFVNNLSIVSLPPGATSQQTTNDGTNGNGQLIVENISIAALSSVDIVFDLEIAPVLGATIINQAQIINPFGLGANPQSDTITIRDDTPILPGNKPLYLYPPGGIFGGGSFADGGPSLPQLANDPVSKPNDSFNIQFDAFNDQLEISRIPPPPAIPVPPPGFGFAFPNTFSLIRDTNEKQDWALFAPMSRPLRLESDRVPVHLYIARDDTLDCGVRQSVPIEVELNVLDGFNTTLLGRQTQILDLDCANHPTPEEDIFTYTQAFVFNIPLVNGTSLLPEDSQFMLSVINRFDGVGVRPIVIYPEPRPGLYSRAELTGNSEDLIKIEALRVSDRDSSEPVDQFTLGQELIIAVDVSDPFGPSDVSRVDLEILDAQGQLLESRTETFRITQDEIATFNFPFQVDENFSSNQLQIRAIAHEGIEGLVTDNQLSVLAGMPELIIEKMLTTVFDPVSLSELPKSIPGSIIEYRLTIINNGIGVTDSDSVVVNDPIPANTALFVGDIAQPGSGPILFSQGEEPGNVDFVFNNLADINDSIAFSNNNGISFDYVPVLNGNGFDNNVTNIQINLSGVFASLPGGQSPRPSVDILFRVLVQ